MSCYHPLKAFPIGKNPSGKTSYHIAPYSTKFIYFDHLGDIQRVFDHDNTLGFRNFVKDFIEIPCGKCIGCRLAYSRSWADRCMLELQDHSEAWFVTLTYDDLSVPVNEYIDSNGEICESFTLEKKAISIFMKALRQSHESRFPGEKLRYFAAGEYGERTHRPHYHLIIYGLHLLDNELSYWKSDERGYTLWESSWLKTIWKDRGRVIVGHVNWDTCAYTARYIMKKQNGLTSSIYDKFNFEKEFTSMSTHPGIGKNYYERNRDSLYKFDFSWLPTDSGGHRFTPSRYFDRLLEVDDPEKFAERKEQKLETARDRKFIKMQSTSKSYLDMLAADELNKLSSIKSLLRKEV